MVLARVLLPAHDCATCTDELKRQRGCDAPPVMPVRLDGVDLDRCPVRPYKDDPGAFDDVLQAYSWYRKGMLPDPGTVLDQPESFLAVVAVLDSALHDAQQARAKREKAAHDQDRGLRDKVRAAKAGGSQAPGGRRFRTPPKKGRRAKP